MRGFQKVISNIFEEHGFEEGFYRSWFHALGRVKPVQLTSFIGALEESSRAELFVFTENINRKVEAVGADKLDWVKIVNDHASRVV